MEFGRRTRVDTNLRQWVRAHLAERLGIEASAVELGCGLDQYGLDSVDAVLMAGELETAMDVEIDPAAFMLHPTLEAMIQCLGDQLEQKATDTAA